MPQVKDTEEDFLDLDEIDELDEYDDGYRAEHTAEENVDQIHDVTMGVDFSIQNKLWAPKERPGMKQRWVRRSLQNTRDDKNFGDAVRMGWKPRQYSSLQKEEKVHLYNGDSSDDFIYASEELILMEIEEEKANYIHQHNREKQKNVERAVESELTSFNNSLSPNSGFSKIESEGGRREVLAGRERKSY